jgi:sulfoquinovose isomerase
MEPTVSDQLNSDQLNSDRHHALAAETLRLLPFAAGSHHPSGGFAWLNSDGSADLERPLETWISTRMLHCLAIGKLLGFRGAVDPVDLVEHGVAALETLLHDDKHGGWFPKADSDEKRAYEHGFVILAASSAVVAGHPRAKAVLDSALHIVETHFWEEEHGAVSDMWDRTWTTCEPYRGANANMHMVEAFLAAADVTGNALWRQRALRITDLLVNRVARSGGWRMCEHFTPQWQPLLDYNHDDPGHPFRPFGATIGHAFEWARLCLHLDASVGDASPPWLVEAAIELFDNALTDGWARNDEPGFIYTTDWDAKPVVSDRLHWVLCEAFAAAEALHTVTGEQRFADLATEWWDYAETFMIDREHGSWIAQLDEHNQPAASVWSGKPDVYHALQATLLPRVSLALSLATSVQAAESLRALQA